LNYDYKEFNDESEVVEQLQFLYLLNFKRMNKLFDFMIKVEITVDGMNHDSFSFWLDVMSPIREVINKIVVDLNLPRIDHGGNPIQYLLGQIVEDGEEPEILEFEDEDGREQALVDYNIHPGDHLHLLSVPIAGGGGYESYDSYGIILPKMSAWRKCFDKLKYWFTKAENLCTSAYAPAEISPQRDFLIRVFVHRYEEALKIESIVKDIDPSTRKKANKTLNISVKKGDQITILLRMADRMEIDCPIQTNFWTGNYMEFDFICKFVDFLDIFDPTTWCKVLISVNNIPVGELSFIMDIAYYKRPKIYAKTEVKRYSKIFISYAHADYSQVKGIAEGCKINGTDYFFDRHTLQAGDIFKDKILQYIDNADLFVLCWSKNAAKSKWVQIERKHALELIEKGNHQLTIYPLSMPPEAPLPEDMSDKYNFATL